MLKADIQNKIKEHHSKKKELDEIKGMFVKPKKSRPFLAATLIILLLTICLPLTAFIMMNWLDAMTIEKTIYVDRTVREQPINKFYPTTYNNTVVNKTVYKYPEKEDDCTLVRIIKDGTATGEYTMHCEAK